MGSPETRFMPGRSWSSLDPSMNYHSQSSHVLRLNSLLVSMNGMDSRVGLYEIN